jgi:hypothetical protein
MDYTELITRAFGNRKLVTSWNSFQPPFDYDTGWPLRLPDVEFEQDTLLVLHFQDFIHPKLFELARIENKYGKHADQVVVIYFSHGLEEVYHGPIHLIEFSNHNYYTATSISARRNEWLPAFAQPRTLAWQCLNGRTCPHRQRVINVVRDWEGGIYSYGGDTNLTEWDYSTYRGTENDENFIRLANVYAKCAVNIVTETQYDARPGVVSEKAFLAFAACQIPIVIGHPEIVRDCQELGFDMFTDLVDTSYDTMPNDIRAEQALLLNKDLILGKIDLTPYQTRLDQQREFLIDRYPELMCERLRKAVDKFLNVTV